MTIARAQMYRQLYQMGGMGIGSLPMDYGQALQVPNQGQMLPPNYSSAQSITSSPLMNYGQTPLTMARGGITRLGYQEGGMGMGQEMMQPQMQDQSMMQPQQQMGPPLEGIMGAMPQDSNMMPQEGGKEQTALLTIIQLLIEQGIPPEQARELAMQILQAFAQGGQPAVEEFANQLEQQEMQQPMMMASGGIMSYAQRRNYGLGSIFKGVTKAVSGVVKGVASAVKSIAKSPIGQIALAIAAPYAISAMFPGFAALGGSGFLGSALRAGISNLAIQGITTGKINPKQALLAAVGGGVAGEFFPQGGAPTTGGTVAETSLNSFSNVATPSEIFTGPQTTLASGVNSTGGFPVRAAGDTFGSSTALETYGPQGTPNVGPVTPMGQSYTNPTIMDRISQFGDKVGAGITNLYQDPIGTIGRAASSAYDYARENAVPLGTGFVAGSIFRAQLPNEPIEDYSKAKAEHDAKVGGYITQYGRGANVYSPGEFGLYAREKAIDPFSNMSSYKFAANGGRINYSDGTPSIERQYLEKKGYGDMLKTMTPKEILDLYDSVIGTFSKRFAEGGYSFMPMGEPKENSAGIMELDYRKQGGFVPPIGIKEKADDIPAMLSNNEFVFTANAVRNAGRGDVDRGAQRMYSLMKNLENGGQV